MGPENICSADQCSGPGAAASSKLAPEQSAVSVGVGNPKMPKDNPFSDNPFNKSDVSKLLPILAVVFMNV